MQRLSPQFRLFLLALLLVSFAGPLFAADATVSWTHPTQRTDNTALALSEIKETEIQYIPCAAGNTWPTTGTPTSRAVPAPATTTTITGLAYGTWCFRARTVPVVNPTTDQSAWAGPVWAVYLAPPKPPVLATVNIVAYETKIHPTKGLALGRAVGTVELGVTCYPDERGQAFVGEDYYRVRLSSVVLSKTPRSELLVAQCAAS